MYLLDILFRPYNSMFWNCDVKGQQYFFFENKLSATHYYTERCECSEQRISLPGISYAVSHNGRTFTSRNSATQCFMDRSNISAYEVSDPKIFVKTSLDGGLARFSGRISNITFK